MKPRRLADPYAVVTPTVTTPDACAGATAVILVSETTDTDLAAVDPKYTCAPVTKLLPVIVTVLPPAVLPEEGDAEVIAGLAT